MARGSERVSKLRYRAFISYSHRDEAWATWLHKALETYRVPSRLVGLDTSQGKVPRRLTPIFRDRDELASAHDLNSKVAEALAQSDNLIVICSPRSAASHWVNEEVLVYKKLGRGERIFCLIVEGEPGASTLHGREDEECFAPALRHGIDADGRSSNDRAEPIAADARAGKDGKSNARLKLIAGLLDVGFDTLKQREQQRRLRRMTAVAALALLVMIVTSTLAIEAAIARQAAEVARMEAERRQAQTEDLLGFMLGDLHDKLKGVGRLDLMETVADKALTLFDERETNALSDNDLARQSQALVQIGQIRLDEAKLDSALVAFNKAYERSAALAVRHPENGGLLFDRGQAEYWIGYVHWQRRELDQATIWLTRYRDTSAMLPGIDPKNLDWQLEVSYGENNLAVLAVEQGKLEEAQIAFEAELKSQRHIATQRPDDAEIAEAVADTISWLGTIAERRGDLALAVKHFQSQVNSLAALHDAQPEDRRRQEQVANAEELLAGVLTVSKGSQAAAPVLDDAASRFSNLVEFDPKNLDWKIRLLSVHARQLASVRDPYKKDGEAATLIADLERLLQSNRQGKQNELRNLHRWLSRMWLLRATWAIARLEFSLAEKAARRALTEAEMESEAGRVDDDSLADRANALIVLGQSQHALSPDKPAAAWQDAKALLSKRASDSRYWRLLDPWMRLNVLLGDKQNEASAQQRLLASGYIPIQQWLVE